MTLDTEVLEELGIQMIASLLKDNMNHRSLKYAQRLLESKEIRERVWTAVFGSTLSPDDPDHRFVDRGADGSWDKVSEGMRIPID